MADGQKRSTLSFFGHDKQEKKLEHPFTIRDLPL